ncbi:unnamed protein product, partial [Polarella glacialis]
LDSDLSSGVRSPVRRSSAVSNKFQCKAVNGLFESTLSTAVLLYAYWGCNFPADNPITQKKFPYERRIIGVLAASSFLSSGLGLMEMDFCVSTSTARRMRRSPRYE